MSNGRLLSLVLATTAGIVGGPHTAPHSFPLAKLLSAAL